jgi:hypothetical protein
VRRPSGQSRQFAKGDSENGQLIILFLSGHLYFVVMFFIITIFLVALVNSEKIKVKIFPFFLKRSNKLRSFDNILFQQFVCSFQVGVDKKYEMTKQLCLELEIQIKESEEMLKKMEATHSKLSEAYNGIKVKADKSAEDFLKAKAEANEFKSLLSFKENQVKFYYSLVLFYLKTSRVSVTYNFYSDVHIFHSFVEPVC